MQLASSSRSHRRIEPGSKRDGASGVIVSRPFTRQAIRSLHPDAGGRAVATMSSKRKVDDREESRPKRQRRRLRSNSEPQPPDANQAEKRVALKRLFGRILSVETPSEHRADAISDEDEASSADEEELTDENSDPLLDSIPSDMDPEALGFLVCAQETLRFLHMRGMSTEHPMFARLRSRLLRGISEIGLA